MADADAQTPMMRSRTELMARMNAIIEWIGGAPYLQLNAFRLRERLHRFKSVFDTVETANTGAMNEAADLPARNILANEFYEFEERYLDACAGIQERLQVLKAQEANADAAAGAPAAANQPPVFQLQMPVQHQAIPHTWGRFNGKFLDWLPFKEQYVLAIHSREMPGPLKFLQLKNSLDNEPLELIGGMALDNQGYEDAWARLCKRYEDRYALSRVYLNYIYGLSKLKAPVAAQQLQHMSDVTSETRRQLRSLEYPVDNWDHIIVHELHSKLDKENADKWEVERNEEAQPTLDKMVKFLETRASQLRSSGLVHGELQVVIHNERATSRPSQPSTSFTGGAGPRLDWCNSCNINGHKIFDCPEFLAMGLKGRLMVIENRRLCPNCLKTGHSVDRCFDKHRCGLPACKNDNAHNSLACPNKQRSTIAFNAYEDVGARALSPFGRGRGIATSSKRQGDSQAS